MEDAVKFLNKVITPYHVAKMMDTSEHQARRMFRKMRKHYQKPKPKVLLLSDFLNYVGLDLEKAMALLGWAK